MVIEKASTYKKYDAVLFVRPNVSGRGHYVLHRILKVNGSNYWIVGDNCVSGEYVTEENILGVLTSCKSICKSAWPGKRLFEKIPRKI